MLGHPPRPGASDTTMNTDRRAKIVCTIGPASRAEATIDRLIAAGMNVARLNMSHGTHEQHAEVLDRIRERAGARNVAIAILLDLQGPKIRTGPLKDGGPVQLIPGAVVEITTRPVAGTAERISTGYDRLPELVQPGQRVLLSDGLIELTVEVVEGDTIRCRVVQGGQLFERQGINLPAVRVESPSLTEKDIIDLHWGVAHQVDYIAVSFVRWAADVEAARRLLDAAGSDIPLIAKLEKPQALEHLDEILAVADGVMVARGDMGVELPPEEVPAWQKRIITSASARLVPVITATQMLDSMTHSPRPTRAEASDVTNAIWDGSDAVMLSAETAAGEFPVETVMMMDRLARAAEREPQFMHLIGMTAQSNDYPHAIALSAHDICAALPGIAAIVAFTRDGSTARLISKDRPEPPVIAITDDEAVFHRMALYWGVQPVRGAPVSELRDMLHEAERAARLTGVADTGDTLLIVGHLPLEAPGSTNFLTLHRVTGSG